jgi:cell division septation protein DedD
MTRSYRIYLLLALFMLVLATTACNGRITSRQNALPTQAPEAVAPTGTTPLQIPATFTPAAEPAVIEVEADTAVDQPSLAAPTNTAVPLPTQEPALSAETEQLFNELDGLFNQIDELNSDELSDLP